MSAEHHGRGPERVETPLEAEIAGVREAIRLNWLEMERPDLMQIERQVIRANVAGIVQRIAGLLREPEA